MLLKKINPLIKKMTLTKFYPKLKREKKKRKSNRSRLPRSLNKKIKFVQQRLLLWPSIQWTSLIRELITLMMTNLSKVPQQKLDLRLNLLTKLRAPMPMMMITSGQGTWLWTWVAINLTFKLWFILPWHNIWLITKLPIRHIWLENLTTKFKSPLNYLLIKIKILFIKCLNPCNQLWGILLHLKIVSDNIEFADSEMLQYTLLPQLNNCTDLGFL